MGGEATPAGYELIDMGQRGGDALATAFGNQAAYCRANGAPVTARIVAAIWAAVESGRGGAVAERVRRWPGAPLADALPLRVAGGLHALHLTGAEPRLAAIYEGGAADDAGIIAAALEEHKAFFLPWLDSPPQTNEAGRSWAFVAGMLWLGSRGLPPHFECLEIGSSAGINLMLDRYAYDLGGVRVGPVEAAMRLRPEWRGPPPPDGQPTFAALEGCDVAPLDLTDPAEALRLKAYIWPEHRTRFARLEAAVAAARVKPPLIARMNAGDFVEERLARAQPSGTTRVLMHSVMWQYVPQAEQARITNAMERTGAAATPERPLAWLSLEANRSVHRHELRARYWPGGAGEKLLGTAHPHGEWVEWLDE